MTGRAVLVFVGAVATMAAGGAVAKFLSIEAGIGIVGAGGLLVGWLFKQPAFATKEPPRVP